MEKTDITIIGAGIVGLATAYWLSKHLPDKEILVLERHPFFGQETSSRNSEVIHAGLYYKPNSFKAKLCLRGKDLLYELCRTQNIPHKKLGKLLIANTPEEITKIEATYRNAVTSGVTGLSFLNSDEIKAMEPDIKAQRAVFSPDTGIVDTHQVMKFFQDFSESRGANIAYGVEVTAIEKISNGYTVIVQEPDGTTFDFESPVVINAAGFNADKIAAMTGLNVDQHAYRIFYNKGQYFRITNPKKYTITHLIYPPPSKTDLGIHITPDLAGGLRLGPDANYIDAIDYTVNEADARIFFESVVKYLPALTMEELTPDTAGVRPKVQQAHDDFKDFIIEEESGKGLPGFINLIGIESPGVTASLAIAERISGLISSQSI